jgi:hypothetical protein
MSCEMMRVMNNMKGVMIKDQENKAFCDPNLMARLIGQAEALLVIAALRSEDEVYKVKVEKWLKDVDAVFCDRVVLKMSGVSVDEANQGLRDAVVNAGFEVSGEEL